jgi:hypothetical protein
MAGVHTMSADIATIRPSLRGHGRRMSTTHPFGGISADERQECESNNVTQSLNPMSKNYIHRPSSGSPEEQEWQQNHRRRRTEHEREERNTIRRAKRRREGGERHDQ